MEHDTITHYVVFCDKNKYLVEYDIY